MSITENSSIESREDVLAMRTYGKVASVLGCVVIGTLFICEVLAFCEKRSVLLRLESRNALASFLCLTAVSVLGFWVELNGAMLWWLDWTSPVEDCNNFMYLVTIVYVVMKQFSYLFLFERLKIVHTALNLRMWYLRLVRWIVFLSATMLVGVIFFPLIFVFFRGYVIAEGSCIQFVTSPLPIILFAISDVGLNTLMLALFVAPLTSHIKKLVDLDESIRDRKLLMAVARRNLIISSITMTVTIAVLFFMVYSVVTVPKDGATLDLGAKQLLHTVLAANDALVTVCLCHALSIAWVPTSFHRCFNVISAHKTSAASANKSNHMASITDDRKTTGFRFNDKQIAPANASDL